MSSNTRIPGLRPRGPARGLVAPGTAGDGRPAAQHHSRAGPRAGGDGERAGGRRRPSEEHRRPPRRHAGGRRDAQGRADERVRAIDERYYGRTARIFYVGAIHADQARLLTNNLAVAAAESGPAHEADDLRPSPGTPGSRASAPRSSGHASWSSPANSCSCRAPATRCTVSPPACTRRRTPPAPRRARAGAGRARLIAAGLLPVAYSAARTSNAGCLGAMARSCSSVESGPVPSKKIPTSAFHRRR